MKVLIIGNHSCGNRGDGAILRGLIEELERNNEGIDIDLISRFPISSEILLGRKFENDWLYRYKSYSNGIKGKIKSKVFKNKLFQQLFSSAKNAKAEKNLPAEFKDYINSLKKYDYVIQVGGSFFVDLYGLGQFFHAFCAMAAKRPLLMLGHSVGPFENQMFCEAAELVFSKAKILGLREPVSKFLLEEKMPLPEGFFEGADTAWLVARNKVVLENQTLNEFVETAKTVAITLRELKPFDKRLGITQEEYENAFGFLCNSLIDEGFNVLACSTCTGIEGYQKDDRMVAFRVSKHVKDANKFKVVMDELNDVELGNLLSKCVLTVGTRLHSAIISMNFGTPAFALNYEHKSEGIMNQLGLNDFGVPLEELMGDTLKQKVLNVLADVAECREKVEVAVETERNRAREMVANALK